MASEQRIAVVTGASSGVGYETALSLAKAGWRVIALGRNEARMARSAAAIAEAAPAATVDWIRADLSVIAEMRGAAREIAAKTYRIDVLINNAGQILAEHFVTPDGLEQTFAGNVLAPFVMTGELLPQLRAAERPHVITTASVGHAYLDDMVWDDLQLARGYSGGRAYLQSKLANILLARELAVRHPELVSSSIHPGNVDSNFVDTADEQTKSYFAEATKTGDLVTPAQGADTLVWLAEDIDRALPSGGYFSERQRVDPSPAACNAASAERLWIICEDLTGTRY